MLYLLFMSIVHAKCPLSTQTGEQPIETAATELPELLSQTKGCTTLIEIWASWCGPCVQLAPHMLQFHKTHPDVFILSISVDTTLGPMKAFINKHQAPGLQVHLKTWSIESLENVFEPYGLQFPGKIPYLVLLNADGSVDHHLTEPKELNFPTLSAEKN